jgi:protein-S-isoprenylcysteine O-methyltransferase Ste14
MYLGFDFLTISAMIYTLNIWVVIPGIYSMVVYHLIILSEEKFLKERFGLEYLTYSQYSRRYF